MKRNLLRILPMLLLGGVLGLTAAPAAFQAAGVKAEDSTKTITFNMSSIKGVISTGYQTGSKTFDVGDISFDSNNLLGNDNYIQIKGGTTNGFWSTTTFEDYYISKIDIKCSKNDCKIGLGKAKVSTGSITITNGSLVSKTFTQDNAYTYFCVMATASYTQVNSVSVTYTKNSGEQPPFEGTYALVADVADLKSGDKIVLGSAANDAANGALSGKYLSSTAATIKNGELSSEGASPLTLVASDTKWKLLDANNDYIGSTTTKELSNVETEWDISITDGAATIACDAGKFKYNVNDPRFTTYTGDPTDKMPLPEIYKLKNQESDTYTVTYDGNGGEGSVVDSNSYTIASTVTLLENGFTAPSDKEFKEWNTQADGNGTSYAEGATFSILKDTTIYAIWKHKIDPTGDYYKRVTGIYDLSEGAQVVFVYENGDTVKVSGGLGSNSGNTQYYFTTVEAEIVDDILLFDNGVEPYPITLGINSGYWTFTTKKGLLQANANTYFVFENGESRWNINPTSSATTVTSLDTTAGIIQYNGTGSGRFSYYTSNQGAIQLFVKSGTIAKVNLDAEKEIYVNQTASLTATLEGATPTAYSWSILEGDTNVQLVGGETTNTVQIKGIAEGTATVQIKCNNDDSLVATCVVTVKPTSASILPEGDYFVISGSHTMHADTSDSNVIDLSDAANMWSFEYANEGENTYYIKSSGGYLGRKQSIQGSGQNTELALSVDPVDFWTISGSKTDGFEVKCSSSEKYTYLAPGDDGRWRSIANKTTLTLTEGLEFVSIVPVGAPEKTTYNVGDNFDPKGLTFEIVYEGDVRVPYSGTITWNKIVKGTKATGTTYFGGKTVTVTYDGLTITNFKPTEITLGGEYKTTYYIGEVVKLDDMTVTVKYVDEDTKAEKSEEVDASKYDFSPKAIADDTTAIKVFLKEDALVSASFNITKVAKTYYTTNYIKAGDKIVIADMNDVDAYGIYGGEELEFNGNTPTHASYTYSPNGAEELLVESTSYKMDIGGTSVACVALKNEATGQYLRYNSKKFAYNKDESSITCGYSSGKYDFSYLVNVNGHDMDLNLHDGYIDEDGSVIGFYGFDYVQTYVEGDYVTSECILLNNGTGLLTYKTYLSKDGYNEVEYNVDLTWENNGGIVIHTPNQKEETITEDAAFAFHYVKTLEEWYIQPYQNPDVYLSYNTDGDGNFGFYSTFYEPVCVYRNNTIALSSPVNSISVDESSIKTEYEVDDKFSWTGLIITATYANGSRSNLPLGSYDITMPDMSTEGTKEITVTYGALGNVVTDKFNITVKAPTPVEPTVVDVELTQKPKTIYNPNEPIDLSGIVVTFKMSDKTEKVIDDTEIGEYIKNITPETSGSVGTRTVRINLKGGGDLYVQYTITVVAAPVVLSSIELQPSKTEYWLHEEYKYEGKIKAIYSDGTYEFVEGTLFVGGDTSTVGNHVVTVSYTEGDKTVSAQYTITVKEKPVITSFEISGYQQFIKQGDPFTEGDNFKVTAHLSDGSTKTDVPYSIDKGDFNSNVLGDYEITVSIADFVGVQTYTVTVSKNPINQIVLRYESSKVDAQPGDKQQIMFKKPAEDDKFFSYDDFEYTSSDKNIADVVFEDGVPFIQYKDFGHCTITVKAKVGDGIATYQVNVLKHVTGVTLDKTQAEVNIHETLALNATVTPADADDKSIKWSSSNTSIATVDANGVVTGIKEGTVTITATANDKVLGTKSASCEVTVKKVPVTSVTLDKTTAEAFVGDAFKFNATVEPNNATYPELAWSSSDERIAKVDQNGNVTCIKEGTVTITAKNIDSNLSATCVVTVSKIDVESVALNKETLDLVVGNNETLVATISPDNATYKGVSWISSDASIAKVDANGKVTAVAPGTATITVKTNDGEKVATCTVTVRAIPVENVSFNETTAKLDIGQTLNLVATVTPENATNKDVTYTTSNADIATVDNNGKVTAVAVGEVTITVTTADGAKTATCTVTVYDKAAQTKKNLIILGASAGGVAVVGGGCGIGIPLGIKVSKKRKALKK